MKFFSSEGNARRADRKKKALDYHLSFVGETKRHVPSVVLVSKGKEETKWPFMLLAHYLEHKEQALNLMYLHPRTPLAFKRNFSFSVVFFARWILENTKKSQRRRKKGTEKAFSSVLHLLSLLRGFRFPDLSFFPSFSFSKEGSVINFDI